MRREPLGEGVWQREMEDEGERSKASRVPKIHNVLNNKGIQEKGINVHVLKI